MPSSCLDMSDVLQSKRLNHAGMPGTTLPPFPNDVPTVTHPLLIIDLELIKAGDPVEIDHLWGVLEISAESLRTMGADSEVDAMFHIGAATVALPSEEKMKFEQCEKGQSLGTRTGKAGSAIDASDQLDAVEFINVAKDDALALPRVALRTYPAPTTAAIPTAVAPFVRKALVINYTVLRIFNEKLGLPEGTLDRLHDFEEYSGSEARVIRGPPLPGKAVADKATLGAHTDFGSLSFLYNRLGRLQVMPPGHTEWSGGILRSNIHRVVPPPGIQGDHERWSLVFFTRPGNSKTLRALVEDSPFIAESVKDYLENHFETGSTAAAWFARRVKYQRINNRKGPETWAASRGTEHTPTVA
ncbi:hypothetical protein BU15DRAFT_78435 [Melanogaster broomeanus]|nr:hypothetical protein BU15DRAFT_78435 [Melanogaster broomeanus]